MPTNDTPSGASSFYVFKSRLQEYAQKEGLPTPEYETYMEGPSHAPSFKSTVIFNGVRYDSLPGFSHRKIAEQSASEVALVELAKSGAATGNISQPVFETGLCKNLLQEYSQKMNYAIPMYECQREDLPGRVIRFTCTVEVGGTRYIGTAAQSKKLAEIKAARTALLAIKSSSSEQFNGQGGNSGEISSDYQFTVVPCRKRRIESANNSGETANVPKAKKSKKSRAKKKARRPVQQQQMDQAQVGANIDSSNGVFPSDFVSTDLSGIQVADTKLSHVETVMIPQNERLDFKSSMDLADAVAVQVMESRLSGSDALLLTQNDQGDSSPWKGEMYVKEGTLRSDVDGHQSGQLAVSNAGPCVEVACAERQPTCLMGVENIVPGVSEIPSTKSDSTVQVDSAKPAESIQESAE